MSTLTVFKISTIQDLVAALTGGNTPILLNGRVGHLVSVEREDGSGTKFNVKISRYDNKTLRFVTENLFVNFGPKTY